METVRYTDIEPPTEGANQAVASLGAEGLVVGHHSQLGTESLITSPEFNTQSGVIDLSGLSLRGIRGAILDLRIRRSQEKNSSLGRMAGNAQSVILGETISSDRLPKSGKERRALEKAARRKAGLTAAALEAKRLQSRHGQTEPSGRPAFERDTTGAKVPLRDVTGAVVTSTATTEVKSPMVHLDGVNTRYKLRPNDLGTPDQRSRLEDGDYPRGLKKAEMKTGKRFNRHKKKTERTSDKLDGQASISGIRGRLYRRRERKIARLEARRARL